MEVVGWRYMCVGDGEGGGGEEEGNGGSGVEVHVCTYFSEEVCRGRLDGRISKVLTPLKMTCKTCKSSDTQVMLHYWRLRL